MNLNMSRKEFNHMLTQHILETCQMSSGPFLHSTLAWVQD